MLRRHVDKALQESQTRADQLDREEDPEAAATWRWIARAVEQLVNTTPLGCTDNRFEPLAKCDDPPCYF